MDVNELTARYEHKGEYEILYIDVIEARSTAVLMKCNGDRKWHFVQSCDFEQIETVYAFLKKKKVRFKKIV